MTTPDTAAIQPAMLTPPLPQIPMSPLELDGYLTGIIVTPQAAPIRPGAQMARLWGDDELPSRTRSRSTPSSARWRSITTLFSGISIAA